MTTIALGPVQKGIGSWEWIGPDMAGQLGRKHKTLLFEDRVPKCDVVVLVKYFPPAENLTVLAQRQPLLFCPIDRYGGSADIDRDASFLQHCARIVIHAEPLRKYFASYAPVEYLDHHVKYFAAAPKQDADEGPVLAVGVRRNLPALAAWVRRHDLPADLWVLTDLPEGQNEISAAAAGFPDDRGIRVGRWTAARHRDWASRARLALDVKADDFRSRHKPPAKAIDYLASGLPLATNPGHSARRHFSRQRFQLALADDLPRWTSTAYRRESREFGAALKEKLSCERVGRRLCGILEDVLQD